MKATKRLNECDYETRRFVIEKELDAIVVSERADLAGAVLTEAPAEETDEELGSTRRCIVTGQRQSPNGMIRFVVAPDGSLTPDVGAALPGRGLWLIARRGILEEAIKRRAFDRAARRQVVVSPDLATQTETLLVRRCCDCIGLARRGGNAISGFEKVTASLRARQAGVLLAASDGAEGGRRKIEALAPNAYLLSALTAAELGSAFGREHVVHAVVGRGRLAERLAIDGEKLSQFRQPDPEPSSGALSSRRETLQRSRRRTKP